MEQLYVSASRAKTNVTLYTDDKEAVKIAVGQSSQKFTALDIQPEPPPAAKRAWGETLQESMARRRRLAYVAQVRAAYDTATPTRAKQQERDYGYGR
jgi:hypothetical protein